MEAVDGQPITKYRDEHDLSVDARLRLFSPVCRAVLFAHTHLVVHRGLKPSNILVGADGEVTLVDFGIAKLIDPGTARGNAPGGSCAHTRLRRPEQVRSEPATTVIDVYSRGAVRDAPPSRGRLIKKSKTLSIGAEAEASPVNTNAAQW